MKRYVICVLLGFIVLIVMAQSAVAQIEVSKLGNLVRWTAVADTYIPDEFEGPNYYKVVRLENGWVIEFSDYDYFYEYHPEIVIFATQLHGVTLYRAAIDGGDDIYDVRRIK